MQRQALQKKLMLYFFLAAVLAGFGSGYFTAYEIEQAEVLRLQLAIAEGNTQSRMLLQTIQTQLDKAKAETIIKNREVDDARSDYIKTVNALDHQLDDFELLNPSPAKGCANPVSAAVDPGLAKREADFASYAKLVNYEIKRKAIECDLAANYAVACWSFVNERNCGVGVVKR